MCATPSGGTSAAICLRAAICLAMPDAAALAGRAARLLAAGRTRGLLMIVFLNERGEGSREGREPGKASRWGLGRSRERLHGLDADDGRDCHELEAPPGIAEVLLDRRDKQAKQVLATPARP